MSPTVRECISGVIAAMGFVMLLSLATMPWWLSIGLGGAIYMGLRCSLPVSRRLPDTLCEGGITAAERRDFLQTSQRHVGAIQSLSQRVAAIRPDVAPKVRQLCQTATALLAQFEQKPEMILLAGMFPLYLEKIAANLERYVSLAPQGRHQPAWQRSARASEDMIQSAIVAFERLSQRLSADDWIALEAEAETLKTLLETDLL